MGLNSTCQAQKDLYLLTLYAGPASDAFPVETSGLSAIDTLLNFHFTKSTINNILFHRYDRNVIQ